MITNRLTFRRYWAVEAPDGLTHAKESRALAKASTGRVVCLLEATELAGALEECAAGHEWVHVEDLLGALRAAAVDE